MGTLSEQKRLDRIEQKLDRLLAAIAPLPFPDIAREAEVFAGGGIDGLKAYKKAQADVERRSRP